MRNKFNEAVGSLNLANKIAKKNLNSDTVANRIKFVKTAATAAGRRFSKESLEALIVMIKALPSTVTGVTVVQIYGMLNAIEQAAGNVIRSQSSAIQAELAYESEQGILSIIGEMMGFSVRTEKSNIVVALTGNTKFQSLVMDNIVRAHALESVAENATESFNPELHGLKLIISKKDAIARLSAATARKFYTLNALFGVIGYFSSNITVSPNGDLVDSSGEVIETDDRAYICSLDVLKTVSPQAVPVVKTPKSKPAAAATAKPAPAPAAPAPAAPAPAAAAAPASKKAAAAAPGDESPN